MADETAADRVATAPVKMLAGTQMQRLASTGGFAVDDQTGDRLIAALEGVLESLNARWTALQRLRDTPALSSTPTGQWVAGHMAATAGDEQGLLTQLEAARTEFPAYIEAIKLAKRNYQAREEHSKVELTKIRAEQNRG